MIFKLELELLEVENTKITSIFGGENMSSKDDVEKSNQISTGIDESKYYICWSGFHVLSCAKIWAWLSLIFSAIDIIGFLLYKPEKHYVQIQDIVYSTELPQWSIVIILIGILIVYGIKVVIEVVIIVEEWPVGLIIIIAIACLVDILLAMLVYTYYRAYRYVKKVKRLKANSVYPMRRTQQPATISYFN
uniref:Uncharacterized protein n=1 Tax=Acrobeloides nanus TaxID=290746 RepID=A0A914EEG9_9BILA